MPRASTFIYPASTIYDSFLLFYNFPISPKWLSIETLFWSDLWLVHGAPKWLRWNSLPKWLLITKWAANCALNSQSQQELNKDDHLPAANKRNTFKREQQATHPTMPLHPTIPLSNQLSDENPPMTPLLTCHGDNKDVTFHVEEGRWSVYQRQPDEDIPMYGKKTPHRWKNQDPDKPQSKRLKTQVEFLFWYTLHSLELSQISVWWKLALL